MRKSLRIVGLSLVFVMSLTAVVGCGGGQSAAGDIVGVWAVANDDSSLRQGTEIEFGSDGWMTMPFISDSSNRAQYELADGTLVITKPDNSVENGQMTVDGDTATLVLPTQSSGTYQLVRVGTKAYDEAMSAAEAAEKQEDDAEAAAQVDALEQSACQDIRFEYEKAFGDWFGKTYTDRGGYAIPDYMKMKGITFDWDFTTFSNNVDYAGAFDRADFDANLMLNVVGGEPKRAEYVDWVETGNCPSGGTYTIEWTNDGYVFKMSCSVHGEN